MKTRKFKKFIISDRQPKVGDVTVCIQKKNFNYGLTSPVTEAILGLVDTKVWKVVESMAVFVEVKIDYTDPDTGNITIDCYEDDDDNSDTARIVAEVTPDGEVVRGTNPNITEADFQDPLVIEAIEEAKEKQKEIKQELIDKVLEEIKRDVNSGDVTAIDELLMCCPIKNLTAYLPE